MRAVGELMDGEAAGPMTARVQRVSEQMGRSIRVCSEWSRDFIGAFRMWLEVMKIIVYDT